MQASNQFAIQQTGVYTILALDACGNGTTANISVDSLTSDLMIQVRRYDSCFHAVVNGIQYTANSTFSDTIRSVLGCDSLVVIDSIQIVGSNDSVPIFYAAFDTICQGHTATINAVQSYSSYHWGNGSTLPDLSVSQAGAYALTVTDAQGCVRSDTAIVALTDSVYILSGWISDTVVCADDPAFIHITLSGSNATYMWNRTDPYEYSLNRVISDSGIYIFTVYNQCGTSTYTLQAKGRLCNEYLYVPNAFTPNGDGVNDIFQAFASYDVSAFSLKIFDRWGEKVYESNNYNQGWDGRYRGTALPAGVYVYELSIVSLIGNTASKKGSLTLIR